ncbi:hypothetical protein [Endothiovibrio diazotrophicus]
MQAESAEEPLSALLRAAFREECGNHLQALHGRLRCGAECAADLPWDSLHQELDSLANAARAVNEADAEALCRSVATCVRRARDLPALRSATVDLVERAVVALRAHCQSPSTPPADYRPLIEEAERLRQRDV